MKTVIIGEWKSNDKLCKNYLFVITVVITLKQEGSKNYRFLCLGLSICFTNLYPKLPGFLGGRHS